MKLVALIGLIAAVSAQACTDACVQDCLDTYYEDYDYEAEQYCYYYACLC